MKNKLFLIDFQFIFPRFSIYFLSKNKLKTKTEVDI